MNSSILLIVAAVAFVFGYRFYSKLLALGVFHLGKDYSTPAPERPPEGGHGASNRHLIFGHHLASLAAAAAVTGSLVSLIWGWIPAFLWLTVGTVTAAGTYGLGSLWLSLRFPGLNPAEIAARLLGSPAHGLFTLLAFLLLLIMNAACATLAAHLLSAFPSAVLPFGIITVMALILGSFLRGRDDFEIIPASLIALTLSLMAVWLLGEFPLSFTGALNFETAESSVSFDATTVWVILLFIYGYHATRLPMWKLIRPRGYLTALLLGVMLFIFYTAVIIDHPKLVAPEFHAGPGIPDTLPWLFITLTSGAVSGFHLLIANGVTARQINTETDARYIGYGGALALGLVALSAVIIGVSGFAGTPEWTQHYASWEQLKDLRTVLELYINGFAQLAAGLGLDRAFARTLAAVVILGLLAATLEAGLRIQKHLLTGLTERYPSFIPGKEKILIGMAAGLSAALALYSGHGRGGPAWWPLFGVADQILAVLGFTLLGLTLWRMGRPVTVVLLPLIFMLAAANWALAVLIMQWLAADDWVLLALGAILIVTELGVSLLSLNFLKSSPRPRT
ncbi:MAG: carbon starvation CstA family protein [Sulfuricaulis sp.]|nr:carbon starvation CstA family protein [Sulfuricaulis sp.]